MIVYAVAVPVSAFFLVFSIAQCHCSLENRGLGFPTLPVLNGAQPVGLKPQH